jgi:hypothetical protein
MAPPTLAEVRAWARAEGIDVPDRGNLKKSVWTRYEAAHPPNVLAGRAAADELGDEGELTAADLPPADEPPAPPPAAPSAPASTAPASTGERRPRRPPRASASSAAAAVRGRVVKLFGGDGKPKRRGPRIKLDQFAENMWTDAAAAAPWPPLQKILTVQAPMAAETFDGAVAGTFIDPACQAAARVDKALRAVDGLLGPPLITAWICAFGRREVLPDGRIGDYDMRTKLGFGLLKYSLMQMDQITTTNLERVQARAEQMAGRAAAADAMIAFLFAPPPPPPAEAEAAAAAASSANGDGPPVPGFIYPQAPGMDDAGAGPGR